MILTRRLGSEVASPQVFIPNCLSRRSSEWEGREIMRDRINRVAIRCVTAGFAFLLAPWIVGCASLGPPSPTTAYSADVVVTVTPEGAEPVSTEVVEKYQEGKCRREARVKGEDMIAIDRPDLRITWILRPESKTFDEIRIYDEAAAIRPLPNPFGWHSKGQFDVIGAEVIDGIETTKYAVEGAGVSGFAWLRLDRVPLRFSGTMTVSDSPLRVNVVYGDIKTGRQPAYDFAIPQNYAGFETRKQKRSAGSSTAHNDVADARRRLEEEQMRTRPTGIPPNVGGF